MRREGLVLEVSVCVCRNKGQRTPPLTFAFLNCIALPTEELEAAPRSQEITPPFSSSVQTYWQVPIVVNWTLDFLVFVLLGLAGQLLSGSGVRGHEGL